jgi:hypothetical protein
MLKKMILSAMAVMAVAAVAAPAASATWTHEGVALTTGQNPIEGFHGTAEFNSEELGGGVHCNNATAFIEMTGGTTDGHVEFEVDNPSSCTVTGAIAAICGEHSLTNAELAFPATAQIVTNGSGQSVIQVSNIALVDEFGECLTLVLEGEVTATPSPNSKAISSVSLSGELESLFGPVVVNGTLNAENPGTYGIDAI